MLEEQHLTRLQSFVKTFTSLSWTINSTRYSHDKKIRKVINLFNKKKFSVLGDIISKQSSFFR